MKLATLGFIALAAVAVLITVSVASSRQTAPANPAPATPAQGATPAVQPAAKQPENLQHLLETFRSDMNAGKVRTLNKVMKMTSEEAAKFWPLYQKYEKELGAVDDRRVTLIKQFVTLSSENKMTNENAAELSGKWLTVQQDRLDLWKKYNTEIGKAVSPIRAAQFLQVEHQIALLVDINIASEMPAVEQAK